MTPAEQRAALIVHAVEQHGEDAPGMAWPSLGELKHHHYAAHDRGLTSSHTHFWSSPDYSLTTPEALDLL